MPTIRELLFVQRLDAGEPLFSNVSELADAIAGWGSAQSNVYWKKSTSVAAALHSAMANPPKRPIPSKLGTLLIEAVESRVDRTKDTDEAIFKAVEAFVSLHKPRFRKKGRFKILHEEAMGSQSILLAGPAAGSYLLSMEDSLGVLKAITNRMLDQVAKVDGRVEPQPGTLEWLKWGFIPLRSVSFICGTELDAVNVWRILYVSFMKEMELRRWTGIDFSEVLTFLDEQDIYQVYKADLGPVPVAMYLFDPESQLTGYWCYLEDDSASDMIFELPYSYLQRWYQEVVKQVKIGAIGYRLRFRDLGSSPLATDRTLRTT